MGHRKNSFERHVYDWVDEKSLYNRLYLISLRKIELGNQRVMYE